VEMRIVIYNAPRRVRTGRAYLQPDLSMADSRPLRLIRPSPARLICPSIARLMQPSSLPIRLPRPGAVGVTFGVEMVRLVGVGSMLLRRLLFVTLGGRVARRAAGDSSFAVLSPSSSAIGAWRLEAGVDERGVDRMGSLLRAGVAGEVIGLARCRTCCAGVVDIGRIEGGGERADERLRGLRTGMLDMLDTLLAIPGVSSPLRYGDGVVRLSGLKLWPTTVSFMLTLEHQRGLTAGRSDFGVSARM
jgi:hypothetical protein